MTSSARTLFVRNRKLVIALTVVVLLAGAGAIAYFSLASVGDEKTGAGKASGSVVSVVDSGFSIYKVDDAYWEHSVGYEVENTGEQAALVQVELWFIDDKGDRVGTSEYRSRSFYVFPGETVGGGESAFHGKVESVDGKVAAEDVKFKTHSIDVGEASEFDRSNIDAHVAEQEPNAAVAKFESKDALSLDVTSDFSKPVDAASMGLVYRDEDGAIVGGWGPFAHTRYREKNDHAPTGGDEIAEQRIASGASEVNIEALVPPDASYDETDVYIEPFVAYDADDPRWKCFECYD